MKLIIGGDSFLGKNLSYLWDKNKIAYHASTRQQSSVQAKKPFLDLANLEGLDFNSNYSSAVLLAGNTSLQACENDPLSTRKINVEALFRIAKHLTSIGVFVLFISSNQVFSGNKPLSKTTDKKTPINQYGKQKAELEDLLTRLENISILRITKVINYDDGLFADWLTQLKNNQKIKAFIDMSLSPLSLDEAISKIDNLLKNKVEGIHHCSGKNDISYFKFAQNLALEHGYPIQLVEEDQLKKNNISFHVPLYTSLSIDN
tara:strand:+ start:7648 stop:8427 length:780 start_codon:yes stop_codon:yes gene_type:complete